MYLLSELSSDDLPYVEPKYYINYQLPPPQVTINLVMNLALFAALFAMIFSLR